MKPLRPWGNDLRPRIVFRPLRNDFELDRANLRPYKIDLRLETKEG